jgi:hypothetical protein
MPWGVIDMSNSVHLSTIRQDILSGSTPIAAALAKDLISAIVLGWSIGVQSNKANQGYLPLQMAKEWP